MMEHTVGESIIQIPFRFVKREEKKMVFGGICIWIMDGEAMICKAHADKSII